MLCALDGISLPARAEGPKRWAGTSGPPPVAGAAKLRSYRENRLNLTLLRFMDNIIESIRDKAERHRERYRSFDVAVFMLRIGTQTPAWQRWAAGQNISALNRQRRYQTWDAILNAGRARYTPEPVEDGPF